MATSVAVRTVVGLRSLRVVRVSAPLNTLAPKYFSSAANVTNKINSAFAGAVASGALADKVGAILSKNGYAKEKTLLATSLCSDEVNRDLEDDLRAKYGLNFSMGGLAGFPFCGVTSFGAMAHHMPDDGSCVILYGPHVGIDMDGVVGKVNRRGRDGSGACCGSANAAMAHVQSVRAGDQQPTELISPFDKLDIQQRMVETELLEYGERLEDAEDAQVELPLALFDAQDKFMSSIVEKGCGEVAGEGKIALLGGIQINTPEGVEEYFLPKKFQLLDNKADVIEDLLPQLAQE